MSLKSELSFLLKLTLIVFKIKGILLVKSKFLNSIGPLKKKRHDVFLYTSKSEYKAFISKSLSHQKLKIIKFEVRYKTEHNLPLN